MNVLVMYDRQTDSLWSQLLGEAIEGEMAGTKLDYVASWMTTWSDWKDRHPNTVALEKGYRGSRDPYYKYYLSDRAGVLGEDHIDERLASKQWIIGVTSEDESVAYPFLILNDEIVVNDSIGGEPILVVFDPGTANSAVFRRTVGGDTLNFIQVSDMQIRDLETSTTWDGLSGEAIEGQLAGEKLDRVKSTRSFWFGWKDFYPHTGVYGIDGN